MAYNYLNPYTDKHFPNMIHGWNAYANDNRKEVILDKKTIEELKAVYDRLSELLSIIETQNDIIENMDKRIRLLEGKINV